MRKRRGRTRMVRRRRSVNRPGGTPETTWEAGWLSCSGLGLPDQPAPSSLDPSRWSVCEVHDPTGEPGAGNPHAGFGERGTGNAAMGAGLRPGAKATDKPPDPKAGAPAPDSTPYRNRPLHGARPREGRPFRCFQVRAVLSFALSSRLLAIIAVRPPCKYLVPARPTR